MKIHVFGGIAVLGMAVTSAIVWSATNTKPTATAAPAPASIPSPPTKLVAQEKPVPAVEPLPDRSMFTAGKTLMMDGRLGHAVLPASTDSETYVFLDVHAEAAQVGKVAARFELAIVIDRSGSMRGKRLQNALDAARTAIERLRDGDIVSVLAYNTRTEVVVPATAIDARSRAGVLRGLGRIRAKGDTCISCAVESGMRVLGRNPDTISQILLLSDGEATKGIKDVASFGAIADRSRHKGVSITTIGVDLDYNERIMATLAQRSNGRHYFVEHADRLAGIFDQEMQALQRTVAAGAEVQVSLAPGVILDHVYDREFRRTHTGVAVSMGSFSAGDSKTLLMRVRVPRGQDGERAIASATLSYNDLVQGQAGTCNGSLIAQATSDPTRVSPLDGLVSMRISRSETAEALERANKLFREGDEQAARGLLESSRSQLNRRRSRWKKPKSKAQAKRMKADFARQESVLGDAEDAFRSAGKSAGAGKASRTRGGKKQIRMNQRDAFELSL